MTMFPLSLIRASFGTSDSLLFIYIKCGPTFPCWLCYSTPCCVGGNYIGCKERRSFMKKLRNNIVNYIAFQLFMGFQCKSYPYGLTNASQVIINWVS